MTKITSPENKNIQKWIELSKAQGIKKHGEFILMGKKLIQEYLKSPQNQRFEIVAEILTHGHEALTHSQSFMLPKNLFNSIDVIGTHFNLFVCKATPIQSYENNNPNGFELICPLGDPLNLGAVTRSAVAFGIKKIILTQEATTPFHPKAIKASAGATLKMNYEKANSLNQIIESEKSLYALDMTGININDFKFPKNFKLIVGEEGPGIKISKSIKTLMIPTAQVESLNANVAASIAMFLHSQQFK